MPAWAGIHGVPRCVACGDDGIRTGFDDELIAAALGWACHLVLLTATNYDVPLPYAMVPMASRSIVREESSNIVAEYVCQPRHRCDRFYTSSRMPGKRGEVGGRSHRCAARAAGFRCTPKASSASASITACTCSTRTWSRYPCNLAPPLRARTSSDGFSPRPLASSLRVEHVGGRGQLLTTRGVIMQDLKCTLPNLYLLISHEAEVQTRRREAMRAAAAEAHGGA